MTTATAPSAPLASGYLDLYPYGHRDVLHYDADGKYLGSYMVPLTLEQVLHPEETDHPVADTFHQETVEYLGVALKALTAGRTDALVTSDVPHYWGVEGLGLHRPDIAVAFGVRDPASYRPNFTCPDEGTRPVLVVEVVSPSTRTTDIENKVDDYLLAGIEWYFIVDREEPEDALTVVGRHLQNGDWVMLEPDAEGRFDLPPLDAHLRVVGGRLRVTNARTGRDVEVGDMADEREARRGAEAARDAAEAARAEADRRAAEAERQADADRLARADLERRLAELEARLGHSRP